MADVGGLTVIVNRASGTGGDTSKITEALERAGVTARIAKVGGHEIQRAAELAVERGNTLVAAGGDGTVSTVAAVAVRTGAAMGVLPLGTLNHFAKDAGIPRDADDAAAAIAEGGIETFDVGEINGRIFLNNASIGMYPRLVWERERERQQGRRKWTAFAIALVRTWTRYRTVTVRLTVDGVTLVRRTPFVFIGNGRYQSEGLGLGTRASINDGCLSVYVAPECGRFEIVALALRAIAGVLTPRAKFEVFTARELTIETARPRLTIALDGELMLAEPPLHCTVRSRALRALVPKAS
jgi:diacylglycerol kinase family enzyme